MVFRRGGYGDVLEGWCRCLVVDCLEGEASKINQLLKPFYRIQGMNGRMRNGFRGTCLASLCLGSTEYSANFLTILNQNLQASPV